MSQESFDKEFSILRELGKETFVLRGSTIIVEILEQEVKTKSGIILQSDSEQRKGGFKENMLHVGKVLMTGEGYWDEDEGRYKDLEVGPGSILVLPQYSLQVLSTFPGIARPTGSKIAFIKFDQVMAYYPTMEAFEQAQAKLN